MSQNSSHLIIPEDIPHLQLYTNVYVIAYDSTYMHMDILPLHTYILSLPHRLLCFVPMGNWFVVIFNLFLLERKDLNHLLYSSRPFLSFFSLFGFESVF